jgi:hypothetical protein
LFRKPPVIQKIVPKAGHKCKKGQIQSMKVKESRNRNYVLHCFL